MKAIFPDYMETIQAISEDFLSTEEKFSLKSQINDDSRLKLWPVDYNRIEMKHIQHGQLFDSINKYTFGGRS